MVKSRYGRGLTPREAAVAVVERGEEPGVGEGVGGAVDGEEAAEEVAVGFERARKDLNHASVPAT